MITLFSKKTFAAAAVALVTIGAASTATTTAAEAGYWRRNPGWAIGAGVVGGLALGAALASRPAYAAEPIYDEPRPRRVCSFVERVNSWGDVIGSRRVCRVVY
jgi:hypothetical protein